jgi:biotin synthase
MNTTAQTAPTTLRHDWTVDEVTALLELPFSDLIYQAQTVHRTNWDPNAVQMSTLLSIKTGGCAEDCAYCPQSARYDTGLEHERLLALDDVLAKARQARDQGATRYCMGAAWRSPSDRNLDRVIEMVRGVRELGMEACVTLGMLTPDQAERLHEAGLDYYNHNIDTSPEFYGEVITTRTIGDRLDTLANVRNAGIKVCCGGIVGMGESRRDRAAMIVTLANLPEHPESVPVNMLVQVPGTPLFGKDKVDAIEFVRTIAVARIVMPASVVRLSAGRETMTDEMQALCYLAGANSVFFGPKLLTTANPELDRDHALFERLGLHAAVPTTKGPICAADH